MIDELKSYLLMRSEQIAAQYDADSDYLDGKLDMIDEIYDFIIMSEQPGRKQCLNTFGVAQ